MSQPPINTEFQFVDENWDTHYPPFDPQESSDWLSQISVKTEEKGPFDMEAQMYNNLSNEEIMSFISGNNVSIRSNDQMRPDPSLRAPENLNLGMMNHMQMMQNGQAHTLNPNPPSIPPILPVQNQNLIPTRSSTKQLQEIQKLLTSVAQGLEKICWNQKQLPLPIRREAFQVLEREQREMKNMLEWADKQLTTLIDTVILDPQEMHLLLQLQQDLFEKMKQLELYHIELQGFQQENALPALALVIVSQPFPESVKQHKSIEEPITARLLTGAKCDIKPNTVVRAEIINFSSNSNKAKKNSSLALENAEKQMSENGVIRFTDLKFPTGTRLKSIRIKFTCRINVTDSNGQIHSITVESNPSNPIVVKTNENQWYEAEGILLQKASFGNATEITWQRLANWLQRRYLMATRQSLQTPIRPLSHHDFNYIHKLKFDSAPTISTKDFDKFWEWCGPLLHKIRYQRHLCSLWTQGYICGFLTREEVDTVLKGQQVGTFLIRFSDRMPKFAVSYQAADAFGQTRVKHYLLKADDTHGAKKTLPDFLNTYRELLCILQIWTDKNTSKRILRKCEKDAVLREYYSKKSDQGFNGYEDDINVDG